MWNRACPICFVKLSRSAVLSRSYELTCPRCHAPLELSRYSRLLASLIGFLIALLVFHLSLPHTGANWVLRPVAVLLAFSLGSALLLFFVADLVLRP
jgi:uncharacterized membrane protein YhhN